MTNKSWQMEKYCNKLHSKSTFWLLNYSEGAKMDVPRPKRVMYVEHKIDNNEMHTLMLQTFSRLNSTVMSSKLF